MSSHFANNARGIAMMTLANLAFICNDTLIKTASERLPVGQIIVFRGCVATLVIVGLLFATGGYRAWRLTFRPAVLWRTLGEIGATILYLYALFHMPIANVTAIGQILPLMITAGGAIFLGEAVGWRRWTAVAVGFFGVMLIMRPGLAGFDAYSLAALASMGFLAMRDLVTRSMPSGIPTLLVITASAIGVMLSGAAISLDESWPMPDGREWTLLVGASILLLIGYGAAILAMRFGELSVVAPFRYSTILFAIAIGFVVWGDVPDAMTIIGTMIVIATGAYTFYRERQVAAAAVSPSSA